MWKSNEVGNRIQSFCYANDQDDDASMSSFAASTSNEDDDDCDDTTKLIFINLDSNVMCWNPSYGEAVQDVEERDEKKENGQGWIFSTPSTPRFVAAEILKPKNNYVYVYSSFQSIQTKNAMVKILDEIVCSGGEKVRIACVSGGCLVEAVSFGIVNFESIFGRRILRSSCGSKKKIKIVVCPSWEEESVEYKKVENGTNTLFFQHQQQHRSSSLSFSFYERVIDQLKYRHKNGEKFLDLLRNEEEDCCEEVNLFEEAYELKSSYESAFDCLAGNMTGSTITAIIMCGHPGGELEMATKKLFGKINDEKKIPVSLFDQKMCVGLKTGIEKYKNKLFEDIVVHGKKIIFSSPNVRKSEREFLKTIIREIDPSLNTLVALVTKPSWWTNSRKNPNPLSYQTLKSYSLLFDPPDCEKENNVFRLI